MNNRINIPSIKNRTNKKIKHNTNNNKRKK